MLYYDYLAEDELGPTVLLSQHSVPPQLWSVQLGVRETDPALARYNYQQVFLTSSTRSH